MADECSDDKRPTTQRCRCPAFETASTLVLFAALVGCDRFGDAPAYYGSSDVQVMLSELEEVSTRRKGELSQLRTDRVQLEAEVAALRQEKAELLEEIRLIRDHIEATRIEANRIGESIGVLQERERIIATRLAAAERSAVQAQCEADCTRTELALVKQRLVETSAETERQREEGIRLAEASPALQRELRSLRSASDELKRMIAADREHATRLSHQRVSGETVRHEVVVIEFGYLTVPEGTATFVPPSTAAVWACPVELD